MNASSGREGESKRNGYCVWRRTFAQGTLTCSISGLPTGGQIFSQWYFSDGTSNDTLVTPTNTFSITTTPNGGTAPGATVKALQIFILNGSGSPTGVYSTVTMTNFLYNKSTVLLDTTFTDMSASGIDFCTK